MDSAVHEDINTNAINVHRDEGSQEEGVGSELIHHCL